MRGKQLKDHNIPKDLTFEKLKSIDFEQNKFINVDSLSKVFIKIEYANLSNNEISKLSKNIFELEKLKILRLNNNKIIELP